EGIQGVGGIHEPKGDFLQLCRKLCDDHNSILILDEVQSGFGRTGYFFAHQWADIEADIISMAKGMGNGFPLGGILIHPKIKPWPGMLGSTFGGNHLACVAGLKVLEVIEEEHLRDNAFLIGDYLLNVLSTFPKIKELRGKGLMIGIEFDFDVAPLRKQLLMDQHIFTGASGKRTLRLLPPLSIGRREANRFLEALYELLQS
ncbi:MAG: aminotransferase class III-fold pyridoxal phosphate-dependent enzyme, partial [Bacteroidota bacterium]